MTNTARPTDPPPAPIVACGLTKDYGSLRALDGLSLEVRAGEVVGLLGPNGAGKTTALRLLAALVRPTAGAAAIGGHDVVRDPLEAKRALGYLTGTAGLYGRMSGREILVTFARLAGFGRSEAARRAEGLVARLGLGDFCDVRCEKLSSGQRQRISIGRALVHDPVALLLDEPTASLDLIASRTVHEIVREARTRGRAVLLSSHNMTEAELLCDRIVLLFGGRATACGTMAELLAAFGCRTLAEVFLAAHAAAGGAPAAGDPPPQAAT